MNIFKVQAENAEHLLVELKKACRDGKEVRPRNMSNTLNSTAPTNLTHRRNLRRAWPWFLDNEKSEKFVEQVQGEKKRAKTKND